uniref:MAM domain-containing protein n=1 Tax=Macrostomum lignano TaxID=282301 RepID=A0A1I8I546_9PLAT
VNGQSCDSNPCLNFTICNGYIETECTNANNRQYRGYCYFNRFCTSYAEVGGDLTITIEGASPAVIHRYYSEIKRSVMDAYNSYCRTGDNYKRCCPGAIRWPNQQSEANSKFAMEAPETEVNIPASKGAERSTIIIIRLVPRQSSTLCNSVEYPATSTVAGQTSLSIVWSFDDFCKPDTFWSFDDFCKPDTLWSFDDFCKPDNPWSFDDFCKPDYLWSFDDFCKPDNLWSFDDFCKPDYLWSFDDFCKPDTLWSFDDFCKPDNLWSFDDFCKPDTLWSFDDFCKPDNLWSFDDFCKPDNLWSFDDFCKPDYLWSFDDFCKPDTSGASMTSASPDNLWSFDDFCKLELR